MRSQKAVFKQAVNLVMQCASFPAYVLYGWGCLLFGKRKSFTATMQWVSLFPGITGQWYRRGVLQWVTKRKMADTCICFGTLFSDPNLKLEDGVYIGPRCDIGRVDIGKNTIIGSSVHVLSGLNQHRFDDSSVPVKDQVGAFERVTIGEDSWIGNRCLIGADVGRGCIIGAGSVVVHPIPDNAVAVGNPAKVIRMKRN